MKRKNILKATTAAAVLAALGTAVYAQDKYSLKSPGGIAFSDFKGYEDWSMVSSARTDEVLKVIVANPAMIDAYKAGVPGNGQPFPEGSKIAKLQRKPKKSTEAPFDVDVPDVFQQAFVMRRTARDFRRPAAGDTRSSTMTPRPASSRPTRRRADCGHSCHVAVKTRTTSFIRTSRGECHDHVRYQNRFRHPSAAGAT